MATIGTTEHLPAKDETFSSLDACPAAASFGRGRALIVTSDYEIERVSDGTEWFSRGKSATTSAMPAATTLGKGQWQVGLAKFLTDGTTGWQAQPIILAQGAVPLIIPSSGSIGDNGALSGIAALPTTFTSAFMYFPTHAISGTSTAGWYYVVMSSTTAGTIYNDVYMSGLPAAPATPTAFATTGPGAFTQTAATDIDMLQISIPANLLGATGSVRVDATFGIADTATQKTVKAKLSSTVFGTVGSTTAGDVSGSLSARITNRSAAVQVITSGGTGAPSYGANGVGTAANAYGSVDTTAAQALKLTGLITTAATEFVVLETYSVVVNPS